MVSLLEVSFLFASDLPDRLFGVAALYSGRTYLGLIGVALDPDVLVSWDLRCLEFTGASFALLMGYFRGAGIKEALLKSMRATSIVLLPLPVEIYLFDPFEFNEHVATILGNTPLAWLSNEVLLWLILLSIATTTLLLRFWKEGAPPGPIQTN